jgi:hypothetical protein
MPFRGRMDYQDLAPVQLARLCAQRNSDAWLEFIRRYQRPIALVILSTLREAGVLRHCSSTTLSRKPMPRSVRTAVDCCAILSRIIRALWMPWCESSPQTSHMTISGAQRKEAWRRLPSGCVRLTRASPASFPVRPRNHRAPHTARRDRRDASGGR